ncbi:sensor histidine kinase [Rhodovulum adriaticum]|uniref:histidine kinase n=2 Tax=Rhodovulum adriaticum TaxID=35804 RepID=A0A4R2NP00_RHOAD|nr:HAMP domain-containing sensor histidine kinase [Rhodovulum adriaticum]TCP23048.1 signal transduction histidine kinase [Rhodovulum adriaticum]
MLAAAGISAVFKTHVERRAIAELTVQLDQVLAGLVRAEDGLVLERAPADPRFARPYGGLYWQIRTDGQLLRSRSLWDMTLALPPDVLADGQAHTHRLPGPDGRPLLVLERSVTLPVRLGSGTARAAVAMDADDLQQARQAFVTDLAPYLIVLGLALIGAGWVQVALGLRPLRSLGARVAGLRAGRVARMGTDWPSEVVPLAAEIDALLDAQEADIARARTRAADLAHGLKTPLQALMGDAERLRAAGAPQAAAEIEDVVSAMRRVVDRELARARSAAAARTAKTPVAPVVRQLIAVLRRTPDGSRLHWTSDIDERLIAPLDAQDLAEALGALAENAARHARSRVQIAAQAGADSLRITVRDDGPGIPDARRDALTDRFARADQGGGHGLGLAIASDIAEAADGRLDLADARPGLSATLVLPAALGHEPKG